MKITQIPVRESVIRVHSVVFFGVLEIIFIARHLTVDIGAPALGPFSDKSVGA